MQFGNTGGMDIHAAREELRRERDRNVRVLQDDDRRRGILDSSALARQMGTTAFLDLPLEEAEKAEKEEQNNKKQHQPIRQQQSNTSIASGSTAAAGGQRTPRRQFVSGAEQLIAPRDPSPGDINHADTVLCVITIVSAVNPTHLWTMPATSHLWNELENRAVVPYSDPPVPLHRTVVATSTHTHRTLNLLSEYVRDVMLAQSECITCVMAGETVPSDRTFWTTWDPAVPVDPEEQEAANLAAAEGAYEPHLPVGTRSFPGELLQPAPGLVGRQWPSEQGHMPDKKGENNSNGFDDQDF